jgi:hypothetical protein
VSSETGCNTGLRIWCKSGLRDRVQNWVRGQGATLSSEAGYNSGDEDKSQKFDQRKCAEVGSQGQGATLGSELNAKLGGDEHCNCLTTTQRGVCVPIYRKIRNCV